jgi:hypothetical protein
MPLNALCHVAIKTAAQPIRGFPAGAARLDSAKTRT